jgi:hypothetical protein
LKKKIVGIVLAVLLGVILVESYFLFAQPNQTANPEINTSDSTSPTVTAPSPSESSSESSDATNNAVPNQEIQTPGVPEFSLVYADNSYMVPPTYSIDEYTGKSEIISGNYPVVNRTIHFTIKNQPFNGYYDSNGNNIRLYYHIRYKGSYGNTWSDYSRIEGNSIIFQDTLVFAASNSSYTEASVYEYVVDGGPVGDRLQRLLEISLPVQGKIDFQVQALIGYPTLMFTGPIGDFMQYYYNFTGKASGWSETQTLTIP